VGHGEHHQKVQFDDPHAIRGSLHGRACQEAHKIDASQVVSIEAEVFQLCYDFSGGGLYGVDRVIRTKEQADHSLPYLLAAALLDGDVMPAQFAPDRIVSSDVRHC
jgi:2-methylcitrate dehydratase PrpD